MVDASVIPEVPNANINAPIMMMAEKAAEDILDFYSNDANGTPSIPSSDNTCKK